MYHISKLALIVIVLSIFIAKPVFSQETVPVVTYNQVNSHQFTQSGEQHFAQFEGSKGDVVYLLANYADFVIGNIELDLRDSVGRTVGYRDEYPFNEFVIAELPNDGLYTIVITPEEPESVDYVIGLSGYLEDGVETSITEDGFQVLFLIRGEQTGAYDLSYDRTSGNMGTELSIVTFSEFFNEAVISVSGTSVDRWNAEIELTRGDTYIAFLDRNFFSGGGNTATVRIELSPS